MLKQSRTILAVALLCMAACSKPAAQQPETQPGTEQPGETPGDDPGDNPGDNPGEQPGTTQITVAAQQSKYYLTAAEDLKDKVGKGTAGLKVLLQDSKFYAVGERVLSVSYAANKDIAGTLTDGTLTDASRTVTATWASADPVNWPAIEHAPGAAEFGILCLPGEFVGTFTVQTSRYSYSFARNLTLTEEQTLEVVLDFAAPDYQPVRKVGVMGDSISTFDGALCDPDYSPFYPGNDPNVTSNPSIAVDSKEKTYWWRLIYNYMEYGELDVNSSWSGTRVIHETKTGRSSGKARAAGFVDRAYDFVDPDIILIHGGTNDRNQSTPVGTYDWDYPVGQLDLSCYRSAYIQLIKMLQARYEGVQLIIIIGDRLTPDYETSTIEVANHFGLPYVNFVGDDIPKCSGSHPTAPAFDTMAAKIYSTCKDYLP